jgi:hypothetical protein
MPDIPDMPDERPWASWTPAAAEPELPGDAPFEPSNREILFKKNKL